MEVSSLVSKCLELVWPAVCAACDRPVPEEALFCPDCQRSVNPLEGLCPGCALPRLLDPGDREVPAERCERCRRAPFAFATAAAGFEYGEGLAEAILRLKHGGRRPLARRLARLLVPTLAKTCAQAGLGPDDLVVPVPLHPSRLRARGFNQALELARWTLVGLARAPALKPGTGVPHLERSLLERTRPTRELGHAGPAARLTEVTGAFAVGDAGRVRGRQVLIVDDVFTTGATFNACADALLRAGAVAVHVLALARAL